MSASPTVSDDELLDLLEHEHPLTSKEVGILTGMHPIEAHNRLMLLYGLSGEIETYLGFWILAFGGLRGRLRMTEQQREEEVSLSLGDADFPVLRCDCGAVFLERNPFLVHRSSCPDYQGDTETKPRRIRERRVINLQGQVNSRAGGDESPTTERSGGSS